MGAVVAGFISSFCEVTGIALGTFMSSIYCIAGSISMVTGWTLILTPLLPLMLV